jgi:hypothetical protein
MTMVNCLNVPPVDMSVDHAQSADQIWSTTPHDFVFASDDETYPPVQRDLSAAGNSGQPAIDSSHESLAWPHQIMCSAIASSERVSESSLDTHDTPFYYQNDLHEGKQKLQRRRLQNRAA